jgi:hypothetical protein
MNFGGYFVGSQRSSGSSLAVRRWVDACRGEAVHAPRNPFRVQRVTAEEQYCLKCCGVRWHDVVIGFEIGSIHKVTFCRACGEEVRSGR